MSQRELTKIVGGGVGWGNPQGGAAAGAGDGSMGMGEEVARAQLSHKILRCAGCCARPDEPFSLPSLAFWE